MPQREHDFIALFADAQKGAGATRSVADTRIKLQTRVIKFLTQNPEAKNWIGILKGRRRDRRGRTLDQCRDFSRDYDRHVPRPHLRSDQPDPYAAEDARLQSCQAIGMRERVVFNAHIFGGLIAPDAAMVDAPQMISRFDAIKIPHYNHSSAVVPRPWKRGAPDVGRRLTVPFSR